MMKKLKGGDVKFVDAGIFWYSGTVYLLDDQGQIWYIDPNILDAKKEDPQPPMGAIELAVGDGFVIIRDSQGLKAKGINSHGQLGIGSFSSSDTWQDVKLPDNFNVQQLRVGRENGYALSSTGKIMTWGNRGGTGLGTSTDINVPTELNYRDLEFISLNGGAVCSFAQVQIPKEITVTRSSSNVLYPNDNFELTIGGRYLDLFFNENRTLSFQSQSDTLETTYLINLASNNKLSFTVPSDIKNEPFDIVISDDSLEELRIPLNNVYFQAEVDTLKGGWVKSDEPIPLLISTNLEDYSEFRVVLKPFSMGGPIPVELTSDGTIQLPDSFEWSSRSLLFNIL
eukprot:gb/GECH01006528.1/.p1 GENE.gb/GECH01006528.1/~~gb/GECH01006528.1/.p1  ORF type:complete len:340 (+),score=53.73 gb/GECH01006528.1/:1-1020(+)